MFDHLTELADDVEDALLLAQLLLAAAEEDDQDQENEPEVSPTLQALGNRLFTGLQRLSGGEPDARPGVGYVTALHLDPDGRPYPRSSLELDVAISRCAAHERGGLLAVGCPMNPPSGDRLQAFVEGRVKRRLGEKALVEVGLQETTEEGPAVLAILRHVPTHRPPDPCDTETVIASTSPLSNDTDVERYVYRGSPPSLSARDTLYEYGVIDRDTQTGHDRPTLAGQIAFAPTPRLPGLAFLMHIGDRSHHVRDRPLRGLCDEVIRIAGQVDPSVDGALLRHMLLYAVVHRSWASLTTPMGVGLLPDRVSLFFPGETRPGWVRNELLLALVRRNRSLGWKDEIIETALRFPAGSAGSVATQFDGRDTFLTLTRRTQRREPATSPAPKAQDVRTTSPARPPPSPTHPRPAPTQAAPAPSSTPARMAGPLRPPKAQPTPTSLPVVTVYGPDLRAFLTEVCVLEPDALLDNPLLYERFAAWATTHGADNTPSQRWVALHMKALGFRQAPGRTDGVRRWQGLRLGS